MSYRGGNFNSSAGSNDWNDQFRDQQQQVSGGSGHHSSAGFGAPTQRAFGSDPFGANDDFSGSDGGFGYDTAAVVPVIAPVNSNNNHNRFGRPSTADMNADSGFGQHTTRQTQQQRQQQQRRSTNPNSTSYSDAGAGAGAVGAPSLGRQFSADQYRDDPFGGDDLFGGSNTGHEPSLHASRANSDLPSRRSHLRTSSIPQINKDLYGRRGGSERLSTRNDTNELNRFLEPSDMGGVISAQGVAVGVASGVGDPYPSLRNESTPGAYASADPSNDVPPVAARRSNSNSHMLPPKKEATPIMPPSLAVEPILPRPKVSRRFMLYTKQARQPDLAVAKKVKNARYKAGDDDKHVLKCPNCQSFLKIPKLAVLMQCPTCSTVSPATTSVVSVR